MGLRLCCCVLLSLMPRNPSSCHVLYSRRDFFLNKLPTKTCSNMDYMVYKSISVDVVEDYLLSRLCRRQTILSHFGECKPPSDVDRCHNCDNCIQRFDFACDSAFTLPSLSLHFPFILPSLCLHFPSICLHSAFTLPSLCLHSPFTFPSISSAEALEAFKRDVAKEATLLLSVVESIYGYYGLSTAILILLSLVCSSLYVCLSHPSDHEQEVPQALPDAPHAGLWRIQAV
jgi:hypothetical protein